MHPACALSTRLEQAAASPRVAPEDLLALAHDVFLSCGLNPVDASIAAEVALYAQLRGSDSHGLIHLPLYVTGLLDGTIKSAPSFALTAPMSATRVLDADCGLGLIAGQRAMDEAIRLARELGMGAVAVRNSSHFGVAGYYADRAAQQGLIGLALSNAMPAMAPPGATEARLGTNPIAAAFPVPGEDTIVLDMATTVVARSRIRHAKTEGKPIPADWALDAAGNPTTDPGEAIKGTVRPIGGPKGFGLGLVVELLCSALSGGQPGFDVTYENLVKRPSGISQFFLALTPAGFVGAEEFGAGVNHIAVGIRSAEPVAGGPGPRLPGARGHAAERRARNEGIPTEGALQRALLQTSKLLAGKSES